MRKINENLYIGGIKAPYRRDDIEFDRIVSVHFGLDETTHEISIENGIHKYEKFEKAVGTVIEGLENDEVVLVHGEQGMSRSVSIATVALYGTSDKSLYECLDLCKMNETGLPNKMLFESIIRYTSNKEQNHN